MSDSPLAKALWRTSRALLYAADCRLANSKHPISYFAAKARDGNRLWGCWLCKLLDRVDPNHCDQARDRAFSSKLVGFYSNPTYIVEPRNIG